MNTEQEHAAFEAWLDNNISYSRSDLSEGEIDIAREAYRAGRAALQLQYREDAERYLWLKAEESMTVEKFAGKYRVFDTAVPLVITDWMDSFDEAIDHARRIEGEG